PSWPRMIKDTGAISPGSIDKPLQHDHLSSVGKALQLMQAQERERSVQVLIRGPHADCRATSTQKIHKVADREVLALHQPAGQHAGAERVGLDMVEGRK